MSKPTFTSGNVTVDDSGVHIKNYYFPFWFIAKTIKFKDIVKLEKIVCEPGNSKSWGMNFNPVWWSLDMFREFSGKPGLIIYTSEHPTYWRPASGVSPPDVDGLIKAIQERIPAGNLTEESIKV